MRRAVMLLLLLLFLLVTGPGANAFMHPKDYSKAHANEHDNAHAHAFNTNTRSQCRPSSFTTICARQSSNSHEEDMIEVTAVPKVPEETSATTAAGTTTYIGSVELRNASNQIQSDKLEQISGSSGSGNGNGYEEELPKPKIIPVKLPGAQVVLNFLSQPLVELGEASLVITSTALVAVDTLEGLTPSVYTFIASAENAVACIFFLDFFIQWYAKAEQGPKYFTKPFVLVDIFVIILPLILPLLSPVQILPDWCTSKGGLITLRLLRILRLQRVLTDMEKFGNFQRALGLPTPREVKPYQLQLARVILSLFTLLSVAAGLIYTTEHEVNPALPDYFTALYFGLTTLTTVGFGDITPVTSGGKLVVCGSILAGVAVIPGQAAALFEALLSYDKQRNANAQDLEKNNNEQLQSPPLQSGPPASSGLIDAVTPCTTCDATMHWVDATYCWSCGNTL